MADVMETTQLDHNTKDWLYNGLDVCVTLEIADVLRSQLDNTAANTYAFSRAMQAPVLEMTMRGVLIDQSKRQQVLDLYRQQIAQLDEQLTEIVREGVGFTNALNVKEQRWWRSPDKLKNLLYDVMRLPPVRKRNAQGVFAPTVNREALEKLEAYFVAEPIIRHLLALRDIDKKRGFLETGIDADGRIRSNFNIAGTNTGRLASSMSDFGTGTNLQNVDRELRSVFISDPGYKFANLDLEQGDARNVGAICWDLFVDQLGPEYAGAYLDACESGDLHTSTCRLAWTNLEWTGDLKADKAIAEQIAYRQDSYRQLAKKLGHATNYYVTPRTAAKHTKLPEALTTEFQVKYFRAYPVIGDFNHDPSLPNWHNYVRRQLKDYHYLTTMFGRRRFFYGRADDDTTLREAIAYEPQSMTADQIDTGILNLWRANRVQLLIQVHDSILIQYPEDQEAEIIPWALETLKTHLQLKRGRDFVVPTEAKIGWNWGEVVHWSNEDFQKGRCSKEQVGTVRDNPDGLIKWKGGDDRKRADAPWARPKLSHFNQLLERSAS